MASRDSDSQKTAARDEQLICLLRHAERLDDVDMSWLSHKQMRKYDPPLSPSGREVASSICEHLRLDTLGVKHVVSSPFLRTLQTAAPIAKCLSHSQLIVCNGVCECLSEEVGFKTQPIFDQQQQTEACTGLSINYMSDPCPVFPETVLEVQDRYRAAIQMVADKYWPDTVLIITHAIAVRTAFRFYSAPPLNGLIPYCGGIVVKRGTSEGKLKFLRTLNDIPLSDAMPFIENKIKHSL
ncbi:Mitochondrial tRNA-specific 2-thiouridylase 1-like [Oopsacas minuta]|uniref:Mitochondrial tRNA-specific 2-thiouridylase 1-like n=1 Tax=Oopsacas minuta TaxID=111878 RepID=A0AAV7KCW5_9METZ|nr:Mitochondrial tRNA-specific 2-thiouridylase 1-like [Oopsacas minuta]